MSMLSSDKKRFLEIINSSAIIFSKKIDEGFIKIYWEQLEEFEIHEVEKAFKLVVRYCKFFPTITEIIGHIPSANLNKRVVADEAWAMMPRSENETVVWTEEMAGAYAVAYDLIVEGDRIAARMAFKCAYERLCNEASLIQKPVSWKVCVGHDKNLVEPVLKNAVLAGRITQKHADKHLPAPQDAGVIAGLLTGKVTEMPGNDQNLRSRWRELGQAMKDGQQRLEEAKKQAVLDRERERKDKELNAKLMLENAERLLISEAML